MSSLSRGAAAQNGGSARIPEPPFPPAVRDALVEAVEHVKSFSLPLIDERAPAPSGGAALIWTGSSARVDADIPTVAVRFEPETGAGAADPVELDLVFAPGAVTVRPRRPLKRAFLGGARFGYAARTVRRVAVPLEGGRELAVFAPPRAESEEEGGAIGFCLTVIEQQSASVDGASGAETVGVPLSTPFKITAVKVSPHASADGRVSSGILPAKASAVLGMSANIESSNQEIDSTESRDPLVSIIYTPVKPPEFVPAGPHAAGATMAATVELTTPAGHRRIGESETSFWIERTGSVFTRSAGGLDRIPSAIVEKLKLPAQSDNPVYGSCFVAAQRSREASRFVDPPPAVEEAAADETAAPSPSTPAPGA